MVWGNPDVYYNPEKFDLTIIGTIEEPDLSYEFSILAFWKHNKTGKVYAAHDSGCSCPSPFEGVGLDGLEMVSSPRHALDIIEAYNSEWHPYQQDDKVNLMQKIEEAFK